MSKVIKALVVSLALVSCLAPRTANAEEPRSATCSVSVEFLFNGVLRAQYQKDFVVTPTVGFEDFQFTPNGRVTVFDAWTYPEAVTANTVVAISFYKDVGVFDSIDFSTYLAFRDDKAPATTSGSHSYFTSIGSPGNRTTNYKLTCTRLKD
jgi:hypothetical protein